MNTDTLNSIWAASRARGWVSEPDAKKLLAAAGLQVPRAVVVGDPGDMAAAVAGLRFPLAAKVVSDTILHKSDVGGVQVNIASLDELAAVYARFADLEGFTAMYVEEMAAGLELIVGAKIDLQFGPVILLGMGGTGVEIYQDVSLRMAPLNPQDVAAMIAGLKAGRLLSGYRGAAAINRDALTRTLACFSAFVMAVADRIESIDLNPVICSDTACVVADARIMLPPSGG